MKKLTKSISLLNAAIAIASCATNAIAQDEQEVLEELIVTGSLFKRTGYAEKSPVKVVEREDFTSFSPTSINDIAKTLTVSGGTESITEFGPLAGTSQINLRGLGLGSTLTLINGRRGGVSAVADGGGNQFFDINQLPLAMIQRIDFLTDGASATYGSQAVAGVANIITRKGFEGLEFSYQRSEASNTTDIFNLAAGSAGDRSTINFYATYKTNTQNLRTDFDWLKKRTHHTGDLQGSVLLSGSGAPGSYQRAVQDPVTGEYSVGDGSNLIPDPDCEAAHGVLARGRCRFDFSTQLAVLHAEDRLQTFTEGTFEVSDKIELFYEGSFSKNRMSGNRTPGTYQNGLVGGSILIPGDHPFNFFVENPSNPNEISYVDPVDWDNSVHTGVDVVALARPLGLDPNREEPGLTIGLDYWRGVIGFDIDLSDSWSANISYMSATSNRWEERPYEFVSDAVNGFALDGSWNPFGIAFADPDLVSPKDGVSISGNDEDIIRSLWRTSRDRSETSQRVFDALVTGELMEMSGGPMQVALGTQIRNESLLSYKDSLSASGVGSSQAALTFTPLRGSQEVVSYFAETVMPLADNFELQLALRYEDFKDDGFTTTDPKIAARWDATGWLALRGSYGTSFQAPSVNQKGETIGSALISDSASVNSSTGQLECSNDGVTSLLNVRTVGSDKLLPQEADSYSLGLIFSPTDNLNVSLDYWRFEYTNLISPDEGAEAIVQNDCADDGVPNDPRIQRDSGGQLRFVTSYFINAGSVLTDGLDLSMNYNLPFDTAGDFAVGLNATWINKFEVDIGDGSPSFDAVGSRNFRNPFRSTPQLRANANLSWSDGDNQQANVFVRYIDSYENDQAGTIIDSWTTVDMQYSYEMSNTWAGGIPTITLGANNIFDEDPPSLGDGQRPGYDSVIHDVRGRIAYVKFELAF